MNQDDGRYIALTAILSAALLHYKQTILNSSPGFPDAGQALDAYKTDANIRVFVDALIGALEEWNERYRQW